MTAHAAGAETSSPPGVVALSAMTILTTDYMFRGLSQTAGDPAIQGYIEATHKQLYLGLWGSNVDFGQEPNRAGNLQQVANLELGFYAGVRPEWQGINFDLFTVYYAYPDSLETADPDYIEFNATGSYTAFDSLTFRGDVWWSPDEGDNNSDLQGIELTASYALRKIWFMSPAASVLFGRQWGKADGDTYSYWNAGLTLGVSEAPALSFDVRYWDTDLDGCGSAVVFQCGPRVVGSLTATF